MAKMSFSKGSLKSSKKPKGQKKSLKLMRRKVKLPKVKILQTKNNQIKSQKNNQAIPYRSPNTNHKKSEHSQTFLKIRQSLMRT